MEGKFDTIVEGRNCPCCESAIYVKYCNIPCKPLIHEHKSHPFTRAPLFQQVPPFHTMIKSLLLTLTPTPLKKCDRSSPFKPVQT